MRKHFFSFAIFFFFCLYANAQYNKDIVIEPILKTDTTSIGDKIMFPDTPDDEVTILKVTIPPGSSTGWHKHENPVFAYVLKGKLTVELENGKVKEFSRESCFAEVTNCYHNGVNRGKKDVVLIAIYLGEKGKALSVKKVEK